MSYPSPNVAKPAKPVTRQLVVSWSRKIWKDYIRAFTWMTNCAYCAPLGHTGEEQRRDCAVSPASKALPSFWMQDGQNLFRDEATECCVG